MEFEDTWEEIAEHGAELADRQVRLIVLPKEPSGSPQKLPAFRPADGPSTGGSLLEFAGTWEGGDLEECLKLVCATRSKANL
jgi:hypothetical protein